MNNVFNDRTRLQLFELEYSQQAAIRFGCFTGTVDGKPVTYTNMKPLNLAGESIYGDDIYAWPDKKTVGICADMPEDLKKHGVVYSGFGFAHVPYRIEESPMGPNDLNHV